MSPMESLLFPSSSLTRSVFKTVLEHWMVLVEKRRKRTRKDGGGGSMKVADEIGDWATLWIFRKIASLTFPVHLLLLRRLLRQHPRLIR